MSGLIDLHAGDCLEVMPQLAENSIDSIVTDPPYGMAFMGAAWDHAVPGPQFWKAALRVAKPGAHLFAFGAPRLYHRLACAIEDAGWELRDCIMWVYGSGKPASHNLEGQHKGWGTGLKPAWEPIAVCRKPLEGTVQGNMDAWGVGAFNIDANLIGEGRRWPANLIHDGGDEVIELFPGGRRGEHPARRKGIGYKGQGRGTEGERMKLPGGSAGRFFYCAKASKADRDDGLEDEPLQDTNKWNAGGIGERRRKAGQGRGRNPHLTVKPTSLMRHLCRLATPPGGLVLDPFMGSGSTGRGALIEGLRFAGIDLNADYVRIARKRIRAVAGGPLFQFPLEKEAS